MTGTEVAEGAVACRVVHDALTHRRDTVARLASTGRTTVGMCVADAHPAGLRVWPPVICTWTAAEWAPVGELLTERAR